jgi:hypothetical protein
MNLMTNMIALASATKAARERTGINWATRTCRTPGSVDVVVVRYNERGTSRVQVVAEDMSIDGAIRMFDEMHTELN